jgi:hypothetical protein
LLLCLFCLVLLGLFPSTTPEISYLVCPLLLWLVIDSDVSRSCWCPLISFHVVSTGVSHVRFFKFTLLALEMFGITMTGSTRFSFLPQTDYRTIAWHGIA